MNNELNAIKNKIIDTIVLFALVFITPTVFILINLLINQQWEAIYVAQIIYTIVITSVFFGRKRIPFVYKSHLVSVAFLVIGLASLYYYNFSGVFYICFLPVLLNGMLLGRKYALVYMFMVSVFYALIAIGYSKGIIGVDFDHNYQITDPPTWIVFFVGTLFMITIILTISTMLHGYFLKSIDDKNMANKQLTRYRNQLEEIVKERTEELETANEELMTTNEELYDKNKEIEDKNHELKVTLQQLKDAQAQLVQSEKMASLGVLTAGVAHEINNPLNFMKSSVDGLEDFLRDHSTQFSSQIAPYMKGLQVGIERTSSIVQSLNQFSRDDPYFREVCDMHEIIENCLLMLNYQIKDNVNIIKQYKSGNYKLQGNTGKLHQVVLNILTNAIDAMPEGGSIEIYMKKEKNHLKAEFVDTGSGMPEHVKQKITDPFFTTKPAGKGTGLGLYISYNIVMEHQGEMIFSTSENKGTKVVIQLPFIRS
ncbi:MAG: hypothetical protein GVY19_09090 [Bacteroidetes bacterium]|jgi:signal transduction histidine kinase|nr:hypothetical protein [Bacteroidota bacterium]